MHRSNRGTGNKNSPYGKMKKENERKYGNGIPEQGEPGAPTIKPYTKEDAERWKKEPAAPSGRLKK